MAGKLPAGTLKESSSSSSSFRGPPDQEAASDDPKTLFEHPSNVHAVPSQQLDPGNGCEFNSRTPMLIEVFCGTAGISAQFKLAGGRSVGIDRGCKI